MPNIFTIGANGKMPKHFFASLKSNKVDLLLDIRHNYKSDLAGFAKGGDDYLGYLLNKITGIKYIRDSYFAPTEAILDKYHQGKDWNKYSVSFSKIAKQKNFKKYFMNKYGKYKNVCLLCAEKSAAHCHRRLVAESIVPKNKIKHL